MTKSLTAHEFNLGKVFSSDYQFVIPEYQRPYRWGVDQAGQLLDDLEEALDNRNEDPYFLGSLVLVEREENTHEVIDGQQRLTTLTILLAVLRELAPSGQMQSSLNALIVEGGNPLGGLTEKPRMRLRAQDAEFFVRYVQKAGRVQDLAALSDASLRSEPQKAIRDNAKEFMNRIEFWSQDRRDSLGRLLFQRTFLVVVTTPDLDSAYRIFSVMNARGLDLSPADIFKSQIIGKLPPDSAYARAWEDAEAALGVDNFTDLFREIRTIRVGERARQDILREFPAQVLNAYVKRDAEAEFINDILLPYAEAFESTISCDVGAGDPEWDHVNQWLRRLSMLDNTDWRPAALWALVEYSEDSQKLGEFLRKLERLAAVMLLGGTYSTPRITRYLELVNELKLGKGSQAPALQPTAAEKLQAKAALGGEVYRMYSRRARYILLRLDDVLSDSSGATYKHSVISLEHVLPQTPAIGSDWLANFSDDEREFWTHRLGNLVLLNRRKNSQARNYDFSKKKSKYFSVTSGASVFVLTNEVIKYSDWTPGVVEARQNQLVSALIKEWEL